MKPGCVKCSCVICGAARLAEEAEGSKSNRGMKSISENTKIIRFFSLNEAEERFRSANANANANVSPR